MYVETQQKNCKHKLTKLLQDLTTKQNSLSMLTIIQQTHGQIAHSEINLHQFDNAKKKNERNKHN